MRGGNRYVPGPCAACGKADSGIMSCTSWGHDFLCCSKACGESFASTPARAAKEAKRAEMELVLAEQALVDKRQDLERWRRLAGGRP